MNLNNYEILNKLGQGAFGVVYKARDKSNNTICVIKKIDISKMSPKMRKNAMQQGKMLKQLNSPYIVKHFHTFIEKTYLNIVMEYCPKGDLASFLKAQLGKPLKEDVVWQISIQMMIGLRDIHAKKILHRDMKSLNIFLDADRNIRIGDLGVAKALKADFAYTIVGTPYYLSPEMCQEKPYNEKTDIWAMGCIIYELCTGKHPFQANNQAALALKIVMGKYQNIPNHYSSDLAWVVKSCLSVDYKRRPTAPHLLVKANIVQKANKLGIKLQTENQQILVKKQVISSVENHDDFVKVEKKEREKINQQKKVQILKPTPISARKQDVRQPPQNLKKTTSGSQQKKSVEKKLSVQKKQKQKKIQIPKPRFPPKKQIMIPINPDGKAKKYSGARLLQMKQQQRVDQNKYKSVQQNTRRNEEGKVEIIKDKAKQTHYVSTKPSLNNKNQKLNITMNRFLPEDYRQKKQFDEEDQLGNCQKVHIPDSDSSEQQKQKQCKLLFQNAQKIVDDDQLMLDFGISPTKKQLSNMQQIKLQNKVKQINWDAFDQQQQEHFSRKNKLKKTLKLKNELNTTPPLPLNNQSSVSTNKHPNLPTIKTPSYLERQPLLQMKMDDDHAQSRIQDGDEQQQNLLEQQQEQMMIDENIEQNQAYISDDQDQQNRSTVPLGKTTVGMANNSHVSTNNQHRIQDYVDKQQKLNRKLEQNKKRQKQLQKMKGHFESELLKIIPNHHEYQSIKSQLINGDDDAIQKFVNKWKGNIQSINLFYRIVHLEMELKRCDQNIAMITNNLTDVRRINTADQYSS